MHYLKGREWVFAKFSSTAKLLYFKSIPQDRQEHCIYFHTISPNEGIIYDLLLHIKV